MDYRNPVTHSEEDIRLRSYLIWEREYGSEDKSEDNWLRARAELDAEFEAECAASLSGKSTAVVLPLLMISSLPAIN